MKILFVCIFLMIHIIGQFNCVTYNSGVYRITSSPLKHPDYPDKCWHEDTSKAYAIGEEFMETQNCQIYRCQSNYAFDIQNCEILEKKICFHGLEPNLYPDCCPKYSCPKFDAYPPKITN